MSRSISVLFVLFFSTSFLASCGKKEREDPIGPAACPAIAALTSITVDFAPSEELPEFLAVAINGKKIDQDECNPEFNGYELRTLESGHVEVKLRQVTEEFKTYLENGISAQNEDKLHFTLLGRASCDDDLEVISDKKEQTLKWVPVDADCPEQGHDGFVNIVQ